MTQPLQTMHKNTNCCLIWLRYHTKNMNRCKLYYLYDQILYCLDVFRIFPGRGDLFHALETITLWKTSETYEYCMDE
jgi:hypothetical protein